MLDSKLELVKLNSWYSLNYKFGLQVYHLFLMDNYCAVEYVDIGPSFFTMRVMLATSNLDAFMSSVEKLYR